MRKYRLLFVVLLVLCFAVLGACGSIEGDDLNEEILSAGTASSGTTVYSTNCSSCHGAALSGDTGPSLLGGIYSSTQIKNAVRNGKGSMPDFSQTAITTQQLSDLIAYIETYAL